MKKITSLFLFMVLACHASARTVDVAASYVGASHFDQARIGATMALTLNTLVGFQAQTSHEHVFKDPVYSVAVPVTLDLDIVRINVRPFYYFKNKSHEAAYQDASAFGVHGQLRMTLLDDTVNDVYTYAFITAAAARQKGTVFFDARPDENRYYSQAAYMVGMSHAMYNAFQLELAGTVFQYPDGISGVKGVRSILDQQSLANLQTLDIVHQLPRYAVGARLTRMWLENGSSLYVGYRYGEFYNVEDEYSVMAGNSFPLGKGMAMDIAYNHVRTVHNRNKRDIVYVQLTASF